MARRTSRRETDAVAREQVDRVVEATRVVGALIAESLVSLEPALTMPQWRVFVFANEGGCNVAAGAAGVGGDIAHPTRVWGKCVAAGLLGGPRGADNRRQGFLVLPAAG